MAPFWTLLGRKPENDEFYVLYYFLTDARRQNFTVQMEATLRGRKQAGTPGRI